MICNRCGNDKALIDFRIDLRLKSGHKARCKSCDAEQARIRYPNNREKELARGAARRAAHPQTLLQKAHARATTNRPRRAALERARRAANPEAVRAVARARYARNPEKVLRQNRAYYIKNAEKLSQKKRDERKANLQTFHIRDQKKSMKRSKQLKAQGLTYYALHPVQGLLQRHRRVARKHNLPNMFTPDDYAFMLHYWDNSCAICGNRDGLFWKMALDHVIPLSSPACPGTIATNMLPLCHGTGGCNNSKYNKDLHTWLHSRYPSRKVAQIEKAIGVYFALVRQRQQGP
jgi:hypothetical protein